MILYHYTSRANVACILKEGITRGEAPLSDTHVVKAVNLTTDPAPDGHGLDDGGRVITEAESTTLFQKHGWVIPAGTLIADKLEARLKIKLPSTDPKLKRWLPWARRHCESGYPERLSAAAGGMAKARTWWLYFGVVPASAIITVDYIKGEEAA